MRREGLEQAERLLRGRRLEREHAGVQRRRGDGLAAEQCQGVLDHPQPEGPEPALAGRAAHARDPERPSRDLLQRRQRRAQLARSHRRPACGLRGRAQRGSAVPVPERADIAGARGHKLGQGVPPLRAGAHRRELAERLFEHRASRVASGDQAEQDDEGLGCGERHLRRVTGAQTLRQLGTHLDHPLRLGSKSQDRLHVLLLRRVLVLDRCLVDGGAALAESGRSKKAVEAREAPLAALFAGAEHVRSSLHARERLPPLGVHCPTPRD